MLKKWSIPKTVKGVKTMGLFTDAIDWLEELAEEVLDEIIGNDDWRTSKTITTFIYFERKMFYEQKITCKSTCSYCSKPLAYPQIKPAEHQLPDHGRNSLLERHRKVQRLENAAEHPYPAYTNTWPRQRKKGMGRTWRNGKHFQQDNWHINKERSDAIWKWKYSKRATALSRSAETS